MPPFLIPIIAFLVWVFIILSYWPVLKLDLHLADQLVSSQFFISQLILVLSWVFSGPMLAAILSGLACFLAAYLALGTREPALLAQILIYAAFFLGMVSYLHAVQKTANDKQILKEKLLEEINLKQEELVKDGLLRKALENKIARFLNLHSFSEELKNQQELEPAARKIVEEVRSVLTRADESFLYLVNEFKQELICAGVDAAKNAGKETDATIFDQWVLKRSQAIMIEDSKKDFRFAGDSRIPHERLRSLCVSPLISENKVLGVLRINSSQPGAFTMDDLRLLDIFSSLGAVTLRNILLYQKMGELAILDSLTGLYLNRYFQKRLNEEILRATANKVPFSLILLDIDHFKRYNDEYGHSAGDLVLKNIAAILQSSLGANDLAARYGGEEFMVLLPNVPKGRAIEIAEKIRREIEKNKFALRRVEGRVTASFGVTAFPEGGRTKEELIWTADKRMYEAKNSGRNRVCGNI